MPGPGAKRKKKTKSPSLAKSLDANASSSLVPVVPEFSALSMTLTDSDVRDVDGAAADDWTGAIKKICDFCHLPDLNTKKGLKRVYVGFNTYYERLEAIYARYGEYPRIRTGIVGIYAKMCNDHLLMHMLFERGILRKVIPLLQQPDCQRIALQALQIVTRHGGGEARLEICKYAEELTRILESDPSDTITELVVSVLSHSLGVAFESKVEHRQVLPAHPDVLKTFDALRIVKATVEAALKPSASESIAHHAIELLCSAAMHGAHAFRAYPDATKIIVAGLSGKDWERRCGSFQALIRLHDRQADDGNEFMDPYRYMMAARNFPPHITKLLMTYGFARCDSVLTAMCHKDFENAMYKVMEDKDYHAFGRIISRNILRTEFSIANGAVGFQDANGKWVVSPNISFASWTDAFPASAKALRATQNPQDMDMADIIEIKLSITQQSYRQAVTIAMKALERNPNQGYWYYAFAMEGNPVKGLKAAKQGLMCSQLSPFIKYQLLYRAVDHAATLGLEILGQMPEVGDNKWYEGIALLHSALEDAKTYISEAPPDNRNMKNVLYWYILLMITIKDLDPDLHEIEDAIKKLEITDEIMRLVGCPPPQTRMRLVQQTVIKHYKESVEKFGYLIEKAGTECSHELTDPTSEQNEDKLAAWLDKLDLEDRTLKSEDVYRVGEESKAGGLGVKLATIDGESLSLYRCGWCGNPSASLRKCSRHIFVLMTCHSSRLKIEIPRSLKNKVWGIIISQEMKEEGTSAKGPHVPTESEVFATLHHLVSKIDADSRAEELVEKARSLDAEDTQLLVDCLSLAVDKEAAPFKTRPYVWRSLVKIASAAKIFAQNHTLGTEDLLPERDSGLAGVYRISGNTSKHVQIQRRANRNKPDELYSSSLVNWVHLSHPNILPLYAAFLDGQDYPCLVSPCTTNQNIYEYIEANPNSVRIPLMSDVVSGLSYMHQFDIVHGELNHESVIISNEGRALIIDLDASDLPPIRYSAPELLLDEDAQPSRATDIEHPVFTFFNEILSGNVPYCQISRENRVSGAIVGGIKPIRPGQGNVNGNEISDSFWQIMLMCWEVEPEARPVCSTVQQVFLASDPQDRSPRDRRPKGHPNIRSESTRGSAIDLDQMKARLIDVLGSDYSPSLRVPEHLRKSLFSLIPDPTKLKATTAALKKLDPNDTQLFVDFMDLVYEDTTDLEGRLTMATLLSNITTSTYIIPRRYKLNAIQYGPTPPLEGPWVKTYRWRGTNARVNVVKTTQLMKAIITLLPAWFHSVHPNSIPFLGVFFEDAVGSPRLCVVTSFSDYAFLEDYASSIPQKDRIPLESILISEDGRAILAAFGSSFLFTKAVSSSTRSIRFSTLVDDETYAQEAIWKLGCLCYAVLSRQEPYYQYTEDDRIRAAISRGELPRRPSHADNDTDEIGDQAWDLIMQCCRRSPGDRPGFREIKKLITTWGIEDSRPPAQTFQDSTFQEMRSRLNVELLKSPLSKLLANHIKSIAGAVEMFPPGDIETLVDFLDLTLKDYLTLSNEQNRTLALLSRITSSTHVFPRRYKLKAIQYHSKPIAEGGYGTVHRGTDLDVCVKVMTQVDSKALTSWIRELVLWAHVSHPNILPFCGVLVENQTGTQRICLKSRLPLALDVAKGLHHLHELGIFHGDLKGENVLISNEGRCLITDFGTTQISTATATTSASLIPSTLRFAAPEVMLSSGGLTKERDIWSFGCLCFQIFSRLPPYYQYTQAVQVSAALARKEVPKRRSASDFSESDNEWDDDDDDDWDEIDDQTWSLIMRCCAPEPEDRPTIPVIEELIGDMKVWDDRPAPKTGLGDEITKLQPKPEIDMARAGTLLDRLQKTLNPSEDGEGENFFSAFNSLLIW
ncbi:hypothetical protein NP233_g7052 [Leucocoprinus birnbaumii]|uniref:Protein kinase domain-containing protein n=1 Tax=Leucocoprinus birnbaumii TaxID=56174 RepID=A0AAD5VVF9_9AGAR|nr:hypothetical protein NP233_g7052 [Leucocoprinus birnbaumii]